MKKKLLLITFLVTALAVHAQKTTYTDSLIVTINEESSLPQEATIELEKLDNDTYNLSLRNFVLTVDENSIPVGHINLTNVNVVTLPNGKQIITTTQTIEIVEGDLTEVDSWFGTTLGELPIVLKGVIEDGKMFVQIDIDMRESTLEQLIKVTFGSCVIDTPKNITFVNTYVGSSVTEQITINGICLNNDIEIKLLADDENTNFFALGKTTIASGEELEITYTPQSIGTHRATVTLSSEGAADVIFTLTGVGAVVEEMEPNSINTLELERTDDTILVNVYSQNGILLRQQVAFDRALNGLSNGVYIVNGRKIIK